MATVETAKLTPSGHRRIREGVAKKRDWQQLKQPARAPFSSWPMVF